VGEPVHVAGGEDEAAAELEGILAELALAMARGASAAAGGSVVAAEQMEQVGGAEAGGAVSFTLFVDEKGKGDPGFLAENAGVAEVAQADGGESGSLRTEGGFVFAQLRNVLAAEDSTVVPKEDHHGGRVGP
jgi:hypothetical protein